MSASDPGATRRLAHLVIITLAVGSAAGRILSTQRVYEPGLHRPLNAETGDPRPVWPSTLPEPPMPTFSSNDRSRWATVRALVDDGTFVIGHRLPVGLVVAPALVGAIDPLSTACILEAGSQVRVGPDRGIVFEKGWGTVDKVLNPATLDYYSSKPPLISTIVAGEYWTIKKTFGWTLKDQPNEVVRIVLFTINLLPWALYLWVFAGVLDRYGASDWASFFLLAAAAFGTLATPFLITFNNHTLGTFSTLFAICATLRILSGDSRPWLFAVAGFFAGFAITNELPAAAFAAGLFLLLAWRRPAQTLLWFAPSALVPVAALLWTNYLELGSFFDLAYSKLGTQWYEYDGSHWWNVHHTMRGTIDWAGHFEGKGAYVFNLLIGHHGIFSLTPVFLLTVAGLTIGMVRPSRLPRVLFPFTLAVTLIVIGFYIFKTDNYGGWSTGPRWLMWLTPLWLLAALPAVEWLGHNCWTRALCLLLLGLSVLSMSYPAWNPWRHPWLYNFFQYRKWIPY